MKKTFVIALTLLFGQAFGQSSQIQNRINLVENNLIPFVPVKGFKGWNIVDRMKYYKVPGLSIAVIKDYKIDWAKGYGLADTSKNIPVTTETMFSAGSISKFLMAATALKLVEQGKIALDSPINNYLSSWKIDENEFTKLKPITLRMLLSHQAGTTQSSYFGLTPDKNPLPTIVQILNGDKVAESRKVIVNSEPNKEFRYSGGGSMIAQMALMDISKLSFTNLTQQVLFDRLGMKNATFEQPLPAKFARQIPWAYSSAAWFKGMPYVYPQQAAAGLYTTPSDLAKFFIDIQKSFVGKGKVLNQSITRQMLSPQVTISDGNYKEQMGIGPFIIQRTDNRDPDGIYFEFTGVNAGFLAYGIASVQGGNGVIVMLNSGDNPNGIGKEIRRAVAKVYNWKNYLPQEIEPVALSKEELERLTGRYRMGTNEVLYLRREDNYLVENINEGDDIYCFPISKDSIIFTDFNVKAFFKFNGKGEAISLQSVWQQKPMHKMADNEFSPNEYLKQKNYSEAKVAFKAMNLNEYQITYIAYDLLNKKPSDLASAKAILETAQEQHPNSSIVYSRWGDYYLQVNDKEKAIRNFQKSIELDPNDDQTKEKLNGITK
jgi:CubicO group peptidase (beta-lactamase class C family)